MKNFAKRAISLLLALAVILGVSPVWQLTVDAAKGDQMPITESDVITNYEINTDDYVALPIEIYDFQNDGMLFEFASSTVIEETAINFISPEIKHGWDFTRGTYAVNTVPQPGSAAGYGTDKKINGTFSVKSDNGYAAGTVPYNDTYLRALRAERTSSATSDGSSTIENELLTLGSLNNIPKEQARYMVMGYWLGYTSHINSDGLKVFARNNYTDKPVALGNKVSLSANGAWTEVLYDLSGDAASWNQITTLNHISINPISRHTGTSAAGRPDIYISHVAFFESDTAAKAFMESTEYRSYNADKDNHAFGLVSSSRNTTSTSHYYTIWWQNKNAGVDWVKYENVGGTNNPDFDGYNLKSVTSASGTGWTYDLLGQMKKGQCTIGLLQSSLDENGNPRYQDTTVKFIAGALEEALNVNKTYNGKYNYRYVSGATNAVVYGLKDDGTPSDLADAIRRAVRNSSATDKLGTISATNAKASKLMGSWNVVAPNVQTYMDAAFYLLNNIFVENAYSVPYGGYDTLRLARTTIDGQDCYVFDAGLVDANYNSVTVYDDGNVNAQNSDRAIYNSSSTYKGLSSMYADDSYYTTTYPFLPLIRDNNEAGDTDIPYWNDEGADNPADAFDTYENRNYNFLMKSNGQFIYEKDKNLFFEFEGDDDVYLFVNGELVLDLGGAHPIATQRININDYVEAAAAAVAAGNATERDKKLNLVDGEPYPFDFFYMERKGYGANLKIMTNMKVTSTQIGGNEVVRQNGNEIPMGGGVDLSARVEYPFNLTNNGEDTHDYNDTGLQDNALTDITFYDSVLGIKLSHDKGIEKVGGLSDRLTDSNGGPLEPKDLTFTLRDKDGNVIDTYTPQNMNELMTYLSLPNKTGVECGCTLTVSGIFIGLNSSDFVGGVFKTNLDITATSDAGEKLTAAGVTAVQNIDSLTYYQWAGHPVTISKATLTSQVNETITENEEIGIYKIKTITGMKVTDAAGNAKKDAKISVDSSLNLTLNHTDVGICREYLTITYTNSQNEAGQQRIIPIVTNVFNVEGDVFVLDYGLTVDLGAKNALLDDMTVINGNTNVIEGVSIQTPSYVKGVDKNHISFVTSAADQTNYFVNAGSLYYRPDDFMEAAEKVYMAVRAYKNDATPSAIGVTDVTKEVEMFKEVTVLPANVVYYEDDFPAIHYNTGESGNTIVSDGTSALEPKDYLLIDFTEDSVLNQVSDWILIQQGCKLNIDTTGLGIASLTTDGAKSSPYIRSKDMDLYTIKEGDIVAVHMKTDVTSGTPNGLKFWFKNSEQSGLNEDTTKYLGVAESTITRNGWHLVNFGKIHSSHYGKVLDQFQITNSLNKAYTGTFEIDYIYVGPEAGLADLGWKHLIQDNDRDSAYGSDSHYQENNKDYSGTGYHKIQITQKTDLTKPDAYFTFAGTGFEIISRTNAVDSATIYVRVLDKAGNLVKLIPVITEFDNKDVTGEEIYQVPAIRVDDLKFEDGPFKVEIIGVTGYGYDDVTGSMMYEAPCGKCSSVLTFNQETLDGGYIYCASCNLYTSICSCGVVNTFSKEALTSGNAACSSCNDLFRHFEECEKGKFIQVACSCGKLNIFTETELEEDELTCYSCKGILMSMNNCGETAMYESRCGLCHGVSILDKATLESGVASCYNCSISIRYSSGSGEVTCDCGKALTFDPESNSYRVFCDTCKQAYLGAVEHRTQDHRHVTCSCGVINTFNQNTLDIGELYCRACRALIFEAHNACGQYHTTCSCDVINTFTQGELDTNMMACHASDCSITFTTFSVEGIAKRLVVPTYIYIDGIRIYNPLGTSNIPDAYNNGEKGANFAEIRDLITGNMMSAIQWDGKLSVNGNNFGYTENRNGFAYDEPGTELEDVEVYNGKASDIDDYLLVGPNNELYLSSKEKTQGIVMYVKETGNETDNKKGSLQIAMRLIDDNKYNGTTANGAHAAKVYFGTGGADAPTWTPIDESVVSGTEQYYTVDYTQCPVVDGYYQVVIAVSPTVKSEAIVSFTNVKYTNLEFKANTGTAPTIAFGDNGKVYVLKTENEASATIESSSSIMTATEETTKGEWVELSAEEAAKYMRLDLISRQMASTTIVDPTLASRNGVYEVDGELYYFVNGKVYNSVGLVELDGKFYYVRTSGKIAIGKYWVTNTNGLMPQGYYFFGEDGAMIIMEDASRVIIEENGSLYYYIDGVKQYGTGLIQLDGSYYYIRSGGQAAVGLYWVTTTNGLMNEGFYNFGTDGKMIISEQSANNGIIIENGYPYYYVDGVKQYGTGLILLDGNYYYIRSSGQAATGKYWVTNSNGLLPEGFYAFGENGQMIDPPTV